MVSKNLQLAFVVLFTVGAGGLAPVKAQTTQDPTIFLNRSVHFFSPSGDNAIVQAGTYGVESTEDWLQLVPQNHEPTDGILVKANEFQLDRLLDTPQALSQQKVKDLFNHAH